MIRLSSVNDTWDWNRGRLILYYSSNHVWGQSGTDNNGNVRFAETWIPPENATLDQADTLWEGAYTTTHGFAQKSEFSLRSAEGAEYDSQGQVPTLSGRRPWSKYQKEAGSPERA